MNRRTTRIRRRAHRQRKSPTCPRGPTWAVRRVSGVSVLIVAAGTQLQSGVGFLFALSEGQRRLCKERVEVVLTLPSSSWSRLMTPLRKKMIRELQLHRKDFIALICVDWVGKPRISSKPRRTIPKATSTCRWCFAPIGSFAPPATVDSRMRMKSCSIPNTASDRKRKPSFSKLGASNWIIRCSRRT